MIALCDMPDQSSDDFLLSGFCFVSFFKCSLNRTSSLTPLAVSIIHPKSDDKRRKALLEASQTPQLFREIREQFPDLSVTVPSRMIT